jgi:uncharacterized protein (DUF58 family)
MMLSSSLAGWLLAGAALVAGYVSYGWRGLVLALTVIVFWLLLQFSRTLRVLRGAAQSPVGHVANAVMLHAKLQAGMRLPQVIALTGSLGRKVDDEPNETWAWADGQGDEVQVQFAAGRCHTWRLERRPT